MYNSSQRGAIMRVKQYINDPQVLLEQGRAILKENSDIKYAYRVTMVNLILGGMSAKELASFFGDGETTLMSWVTKVDQFGWDALHAKKQTGQPRRLSDGQIEVIKSAVQSDPENFGFRVWDGPALSKYIKNTFGVEYSIRACQKLFHKMGFSLIRPQTYPSLENPDEEARESFKKNSRN